MCIAHVFVYTHSTHYVRTYIVVVIVLLEKYIFFISTRVALYSGCIISIVCVMPTAQNAEILEMARIICNYLPLSTGYSSPLSDPVARLLRAHQALDQLPAPSHPNLLLSLECASISSAISLCVMFVRSYELL